MAIEEVNRSLAVKLASELDVRNELRNFLAALRSFAFLYSQVQPIRSIAAMRRASKA
jgi:hypothetical protein